jgi:hypothetical protein
MTSEQVPSSYQAAITSARADLTNLGACSREFIRHFSPRAVLAGIAVALTARIAVGGWSWRDLVVPLGVLAAQPFVEWVIHRYLLHMPAFTVAGRRIELYPAYQHRDHHRRPSELDRVLLKPPEVLSFLVQIAIVAPLVMWGLVAVFGGEPAPLALTAILFSYLGLVRYEYVHFLIHTPYVPKSRWYRAAWRNHRLHHFKHEGYWMGITSNLGDRVLRTNPDHRTVPRSPTARTLGVEPE